MLKFKRKLLAVSFSVVGACGGSSDNDLQKNTSSTQTIPTIPFDSENIPTNSRLSPNNTSPTETLIKKTPNIDSSTIQLIAFNDFPGSILLGKPTNNAITISVITQNNAELIVSYGPVSGSHSNQSEKLLSVGTIPREIELSNLSQNTQYFYSLHYKESNSDEFTVVEEARFFTQRSAGETFNFAIHADAHIGIRLRGPNEFEKADDDQYTRTLLNTLAFSPDFLIDLGDTFMSEKNWLQDYYDMTDSHIRTEPKAPWVEEDYIFLRSFFNIIGHSTPLFLVNGNHEGETGWEKHNEESVAIWANNYRKELYPVPSNNNFYSASSEIEPYAGKHSGYYSWTWGSALFVVLDPFWYADSKPKAGNEWAWTLGKDQYNWLNQTLESSNATFKFIFLHNLVGGLNGEGGVGTGRGGALVASDWEWGGMNPHTGQYEFNQQRPGWGRPIHDVLVDNNVNVVFHGHDHVFVKEDHPDGIIYQTVPQPSILGETTGRATKRANESGYDANTSTVIGGSGFVNVNVSASTTTISLIASNDNIDSGNCGTPSCYSVAYSYNTDGTQAPNPTPNPTPFPTSPPNPTPSPNPVPTNPTPTNPPSTIDCENVNIYPNWVSRDWPGGEPNHNNQGDPMVFQNTLYIANWYTQTQPGGDGSWTLIGRCGSTPSPTPSPMPTPIPPSPTPAPLPTPTSPPGSSSMKLSSAAFKETGSVRTILPLAYTCDGKNSGQSPMLQWSGVPSSAVSLTLIMHSQTEGAHFTIFDIPPSVTQLVPGDMSIGKAARGDMSENEIEQAGGMPFDAPCAPGAGNTNEYIFTLYALANNIGLNEGVNQSQVLQAINGSIIDSTSLITTRVRWDTQSIANDLHVPRSVPITCAEKTEHFMAYSRAHKSVSCNQAINQMNIVSHISDGLKTPLNDQQIQVGITDWIGRLSFPSQAGGELRLTPSYLNNVNNNISCDGTGKLGISVDGQIILPYYKQTGDSGGDTCGPTDGTNYANRDTVVLGEVDQCYGHSPNGEGYHLHGAPICLMDVHDPSKPVAYMSDGIPLYFGQAGGTIENTEHALSVANPTDTNFGANLYDHLDFRPSDVKDGSNPLNECNAYDLNNDGDKSGYIYYTTKDAPYAIGCFMGEVLNSPRSVPVTRTNFSGIRQGWSGQTIGQGISVDIVSNFIGNFNNKTYNITEMLVTENANFLNVGDYAQVLWRFLEPNDQGYSSSKTCFELRYRANKQVTNNDETETICSENLVPNETLNFTPFELSPVTPDLKSSVPNNSEPTEPGNGINFKLEAWGDNWFAAYLNDELILEDSVPITTEKSFNSETTTFNAQYPLHLNFILKDFKENDTGLEYIGDTNQQMGDGGFIAQITDLSTQNIVATTNSNWKCAVIHNAPLNRNCENSNNPIAGVAPCEFTSSIEPNNWKGQNYNDSSWPNAREYSATDVDPKEGYYDINWHNSTRFIWGPDLETNNTLLCRVTINSP